MATAAFPLVLVVLSASFGISAGLDVTALSPVLGALGEEVSIVCKADDIPDSCSFTRYRRKMSQLHTKRQNELYSWVICYLIELYSRFC